MKKLEILDIFPEEGFIKTSKNAPAAVTDSQKAALNRKGNEFFNTGRYDEARRVFITTGYSDGLIRLGDYYYQSGEPLEALKMYWLSKSQSKKDFFVEKISSVIQKWIKDGDEKS